MADPLFQWQGHEFEHSEKSSDWYWVMGAIAGLALLLALLTKNFLFAVIIIIASFATYLINKHGPNFVDFSIKQDGIRAGDQFYKFESIKSFWIQEEREPVRLVLELDRIFFPHTYIPLGDMDINDIKGHLKEIIDEIEYEEPFGEKILEIFGI